MKPLRFHYERTEYQSLTTVYVVEYFGRLKPSLLAARVFSFENVLRSMNRRRPVGRVCRKGRAASVFPDALFWGAFTYEDFRKGSSLTGVGFDVCCSRGRGRWRRFPVVIAVVLVFIVVGDRVIVVSVVVVGGGLFGGGLRGPGAFVVLTAVRGGRGGFGGRRRRAQRQYRDGQQQRRGHSARPVQQHGATRLCVRARDVVQPPVVSNPTERVPDLNTAQSVGSAHTSKGARTAADTASDRRCTTVRAQIERMNGRERNTRAAGPVRRTRITRAHTCYAHKNMCAIN